MDTLFEHTIDVSKEMAAYEFLWRNKYNSYKKMSDLFKTSPGNLPSFFVDPIDLEKDRKRLKDNFIFKDDDIFPKFVIKQTLNYPEKLKDALNPLIGFYYDGNLDLLGSKSIAVVGSRKATKPGMIRASKLARLLVENDITVVSGLAKGIDTAALNSAIRNNGRTIGVIGTPLNQFYPRENEALQRYIAKNHLLISQVPFLGYNDVKDYRYNRSFFPERNRTMSAITEGTVIVEAGETSGTLIQARAAIAQGRKLFILQSCFENKSIEWPNRFEKKGAIRVKDIDDILKYL